MKKKTADKVIDIFSNSPEFKKIKFFSREAMREALTGGLSSFDEFEMIEITEQYEEYAKNLSKAIVEYWKAEQMRSSGEDYL